MQEFLRERETEKTNNQPKQKKEKINENKK